MEAKPEHLAQYAHIPDLHRRTMLGMMASLDENVGRVLTKLRETKLEENTLIFFLSDNGGPTGKPRKQPNADFQYGQNTSKNHPCRGVKGDLLEGGIRVPFLVQWKGRIPEGRTYDHSVISLDNFTLHPPAVTPIPAPLRLRLGRQSSASTAKPYSPATASSSNPAACGRDNCVRMGPARRANPFVSTVTARDLMKYKPGTIA